MSLDKLRHRLEEAHNHNVVILAFSKLQNPEKPQRDSF